MPTFLVSGANGQLGRRAVEILLERGGATVVAATRDPLKVADLAAKGAEIRRLDWTDAASLASAFAGVDRALIVSGDQLLNRSENQVRAVEVAVAAGVKHVTYTSMPTPERYQDIPIAPSHLATEQALAKSGVPYAALQNIWYADGLIDVLKRAIGEGKWFTAAGEGKVAYVTRDDCARVAAAAIVDAATGTFPVSGPEALSARDVAAIATELTGKPIEVVTISDDQLAAGMRSGHVPDEIIRLVVGIEKLNREGGAAAIHGTIEKLTGTKPQSIRDFLAAHKAQLI